MVLQLPPSKISPFDLFTAALGNKGLLQHWQWIFFLGDPARTVKYHGFATTPPQKFHCCIFCKYVCANTTIYICVFKYMYVHIYMYIYIHIYIYMNVWKYECMNACMYVRSKLNGVPYHLWAKMLHPEDPPPHLLEAQKTCGGGIFHVVRWNISQKFLALPPQIFQG